MIVGHICHGYYTIYMQRYKKIDKVVHQTCNILQNKIPN